MHFFPMSVWQWRDFIVPIKQNVFWDAKKTSMHFQTAWLTKNILQFNFIVNLLQNEHHLMYSTCQKERTWWILRNECHHVISHITMTTCLSSFSNVQNIQTSMNILLCLIQAQTKLLGSIWVRYEQWRPWFGYDQVAWLAQAGLSLCW